MKVLCNKTTKKIEGFVRFGGFEHDPLTHIELIVTNIPDMGNERLNDTEDDLRPMTAGEVTAQTEKEKDNTVNAEFTPALLALINALDPANATAIIAMAKANRKAEL